MRLTRLKIHNILGHEDLDVKFSGINEISGPNGSGKSTILKAIQAAVGGTDRAEQAKLLRKGATEGEIVLVLDDSLKVTRRLDNEGKNTISIVDTNTRAKYNQGFLDGLLDQLAMNPLRFLTAPVGERAELMLEAIPMEIDRAEFDKIVGPFALRTVPKAGHPLQLIDAADKEIREQRKTLKRDLEDRRKTVATIWETLPEKAAAETDWDGTILQLEKELAGVRAKVADHKVAAERELATAKADNQEEFDAAIRRAEGKRDEVLAEADALIAKANQMKADARAEYEQTAGRCLDFKRDLDEKARAAIDEKRDAAVGELNAQIAELGGKLSEARAAADAVNRSQATRKLAEDKKAEADELEGEWELRNQAISKLEKLKLKLTSNLPIEGLEINSGAISVKGIPFDTLNTAQQVKVAFEIAALRASGGEKLEAIVCDGLELLDSETLAEFYKQAEATGMQLIVTRVSDKPFNIETR